MSDDAKRRTDAPRSAEATSVYDTPCPKCGLTGGLTHQCRRPNEATAPEDQCPRCGKDVDDCTCRAPRSDGAPTPLFRTIKNALGLLEATHHEAAAKARFALDELMRREDRRESAPTCEHCDQSTRIIVDLKDEVRALRKVAEAAHAWWRADIDHDDAEQEALTQAVADWWEWRVSAKAPTQEGK